VTWWTATAAPCPHSSHPPLAEPVDQLLKRTLLRVLSGVVTGAGLLAAGAVTDRAYLEGAGVVIVLLFLVAAVASRRRYLARARPARSGAGTTAATGTKRRPGQGRRARMTHRMDQRWRRRQDGTGGRPGPTRS